MEEEKQRMVKQVKFKDFRITGRSESNYSPKAKAVRI